MRRAIRLWLYGDGGAARADGDGRRRDPPHRFRSVDRRMAPGDGAVPPLSEADWNAEFAKYQTSSEYELVNKGMTLDDFKRIYWWEWGHRLLGRLIGVAFVLPLSVLPPARMDRAAAEVAPLADLRARRPAGRDRLVDGGFRPGGPGGRGAGAACGPPHHCLPDPDGDRLDGADIWRPPAAARQPRRAGWRRRPPSSWSCSWCRLRSAAWLPASRRAWSTTPGRSSTVRSFPSLDRLLFNKPAWTNLVDNHLTVQFMHRMVAYLLLGLAALHAADCMRHRIRPHPRRGALAAARAADPGAARHHDAALACAARARAPAPGGGRPGADRGDAACGSPLRGQAITRSQRRECARAGAGRAVDGMTSPHPSARPARGLRP